MVFIVQYTSLVRGKWGNDAQKVIFWFAYSQYPSGVREKGQNESGRVLGVIKRPTKAQTIQAEI